MDNPQKIIVIGLGPAGLIAAARASELGAHVLALEANSKPGRKLLITGKGRCNLTNANALSEFIDAFGQTGKFLYGSFSRFFRPELLALLKKYNVETVIERGNRIFPASQQSSSVLQALADHAKQTKAQIKFGEKAKKLLIENDRIKGVETSIANYLCDAVIIATGGKSYPATGSTGDGYKLARQARHDIILPLPALVPLVTKESWIERLAGLSLKNVKLEISVNKKTIGEDFGEMLFTHHGISGPIVLDLSRSLVNRLRQDFLKIRQKELQQNKEQFDLFVSKQSISATLDLKPALSENQLTKRLQREFDSGGKKYFASILKMLLPSSFIPVMIDLSAIPRDKLGNQIGKQERQRLLYLFKQLTLTISKLGSWGEAIITSGGVNLTEINPKTMESKLVKGLYFAGEVLDLDARTGGYNLQAAFSTGWVAGDSAAGS